MRHFHLQLTLAAALAGLPLIASGPPVALTVGERPALGAQRLAQTTAIQQTARAVRPAPAAADRDRSHVWSDGCVVLRAATRSPRCVYGDAGSRTTVVLLGDSHAMQYFPPLEQIANRRHWRLVALIKTACFPAESPLFTASLETSFPQCATWLRDAMARVRRLQPAMTIVSGSSDAAIVAGDRSLYGTERVTALGAAAAEMLADLERATRHVVFIQDNPRPPFYVPDCVAGSLDALPRCAFARDPAIAYAAAIRAGAGATPGVRFIDPTPEFCPQDGICPAVIGDVLVYRQSGHVTATYTRTMAPWLRRRLGEISPPSRRSSRSVGRSSSL